jgi:hypothetical protein
MEPGQIRAMPAHLLAHDGERVSFISVGLSVSQQFAG